MTSRIFTRRDAVTTLATIPMSFAFTGCIESSHAPAGVVAPFPASRAGANGLSRGAESIHQEVSFKAARVRLCAALMDPAQFDRITQLSNATRSFPAGAPPTEISPGVGGAFVLFGGYVTGRHLELVPGERLVQAWRAGGWPAGAYSICDFRFVDEGTGTRIVFDHVGFPDGAGAGLASGWYEHYWNPLTRLLG
jgi:activator of HSP90 ATPase